MICNDQLENIISLESIIENILMEISEQKRQFVTKYDEHKIMDEIKKYTENLSNINLKNLDLQKKNETIENLSASLFDQVSQTNFD